MADLRSIGVSNIRVDRVRSVGRGGSANDVAQLCGRCGDGIASISSNGDVTPCVFSRWLSVGNVRENSLGQILAGPAMVQAVARIPARHENACDPDTECTPGVPPSECSPRN